MITVTLRKMPNGLLAYVITGDNGKQDVVYAPRDRQFHFGGS